MFIKVLDQGHTHSAVNIRRNPRRSAGRRPDSLQPVIESFYESPKRAADFAFAFAASSSRFRGGAVVYRAVKGVLIGFGRFMKPADFSHKLQ